MNRHHFENGFF